jgi:hypothetical protein
MSLLDKLGLPPRSASAPPKTRFAARPVRSPGAKPTAARGKTVVPGPDATDGRRTRLDLGDDPDTVTIADDAETPTTGAGAGPPTAAPKEAGAPADAAGPKKMRVDIVNRSGFELRRHALGTEDSEHVEYEAQPSDAIADKGFTGVVAKAKGEDATGPAGDVVYRVLDPKGEILVSMTWRHGASPVGKAKPNDGRVVVQAIKKGDDRFQYVVVAGQGKPAPDPLEPMKIRLDNFSGTTLFRENFGLDNPKAQFNPEPPKILDGGKGRFVFTVSSLDAEFPQLSGFADYSFTVEPPRMDENPSGKYRMSIAWAEDGVQIGNITPEGKNMEIEFGGDERNPIFSFFGASPEFKPPGKASEPTLRQGDKSPDGWVEYLQELLNRKGAKLDIDGDFGGETLKAVKAFQRSLKKQGVLEDGVVGAETWSFLREGAPAKPKTDGRKPHTFVEKGNSARWALESGMPFHDEASDTAVMQAVSVGDVVEIARRIVRFRIVSPSGEEKLLDRPIGEPFEVMKTNQGNRHKIVIDDFSELFGKPPVPKKPPPGDYRVTAYFPADLSGDTFDGVLNIPQP